MGDVELHPTAPQISQNSTRTELTICSLFICHSILLRKIDYPVGISVDRAENRGEKVQTVEQGKANAL